MIKTINFFENLSQYNWDGDFYDLHNNYECKKIFFSDEILLITFENIWKEKSVSLKFTGVRISAIDFYNSKGTENLTIDNIYRGRFEENGILKEISEEEQAYFYLEFYEGQKIEFWAKEISIHHE